MSADNDYCTCCPSLKSFFSLSLHVSSLGEIHTVIDKDANVFDEHYNKKSKDEIKKR